jgi:predicted AlkP superfamily phosphohydrolase/phosphomutase
LGGELINNNGNNARVLIVGLDGATLSHIQSLIAKKKLPFLHKLMATGSYGNLKSSLPLNSAASWASFFSGKNPGKHNIYDFLKPNGSLSNPSIINNDSIKSDLIWHTTDKHSLKTIYFNIPIVTEPVKINGIMVSGFATSEETPFAYPNSIYRDLLDQNYKTDCAPFWHFSADDYFNEIKQIFEKQSNSFHQFIRDFPWDLAIVTFNALNRIQQSFGDDEDKVETLYSMFDSYLQRLHDSIEQDTYFLLLSNHGFKPVTKKFFVNEWLWELDLLNRKLTTKQSRITDIDEFLFNSNGDRDALLTKVLTKSGITKKNIRSILPNSTRESLKQALPLSIKRLFRREYLDIKWKKTLAYFVSDTVQGININLKGREPFGIVEPGKEYDLLRDKIISELYHYKDPYTFEHIIEEVHKKEDFFQGEYIENAPDIIIVPFENNYYLDSNKRTSRMVVGASNDEYPVYGQKDRNGIFFMTGPKIKKGETISNLSIYDIVPTILHLFGIKENNGFDGKVVKKIFSEFEH